MVFDEPALSQRSVASSAAISAPTITPAAAISAPAPIAAMTAVAPAMASITTAALGAAVMARRVAPGIVTRGMTPLMCVVRAASAGRGACRALAACVIVSALCIAAARACFLRTRLAETHSHCDNSHQQDSRNQYPFHVCCPPSASSDTQHGK